MEFYLYGIFACLLILLLIGVPVAFSLMGTALLFLLLGLGNGDIGSFDIVFNLAQFRVYEGIMQKSTLIAVPLFVFMGIALEQSKVAQEMLSGIERLSKRVRGGLALAVIAVGALIAASTGIVGATVVTMGVISLPSMLERGYDKGLSCGCIAASGTLGQIIPPSIVLVIIGDIMSIDVGDMFVGAIIPGLILVGMYALYVFIRVLFQPHLAPRDESSERISAHDVFSLLLHGIFPALVLIVCVLGAIITGIASPTEAAGCGALGSLLIIIFKRRLSFELLKNVSYKTVLMTSMVFTILIAAQFFGVVFRLLDGDTTLEDLVLQLELQRHTALIGIMILVFVLGFFLDFLEICFIVIPIILPLLSHLGLGGAENALVLAILIAVNLQASFLTPPFGFSLFYLKGVVPDSVSTMDIYKGVIPFVVIQVSVLILLICFPQVITFLPELVFPDAR